MKAIGIIPARYASSRFPGKPLAVIAGKSMIQLVYEACKKSSSLVDIYVATDDERIYQAVESFGGKVMMTSPKHPSGTDRCAEVCQHIEADYIINIQGDEPLIHPSQIDLVANRLKSGAAIATLARKIDREKAQNPNIVKVVRTNQQKALYFSRLPIPFHSQELYLQHIGIYGFRKEILQQLTLLPPSPLEVSEKLEQLRWLENGYEIYIDTTEKENISIDTPEDLNKLNSFIHNLL